MMVYLWGAALFIFLFTVPTQTEDKKDSISIELTEEDYNIKQIKEPKRRYKLKDVR